MKNVRIMFRNKGMDSEVNLSTKGEYGNNRLIFVDDEGNTNYVVLKEQQIEYYKKGTVSMKYTFDENVKTNGTYQAMGNVFKFLIVTKTLEISTSRIHIEFSIYQGDDLVNENILDITYQEE